VVDVRLHSAGAASRFHFDTAAASGIPILHPGVAALLIAHVFRILPVASLSNPCRVTADC
jgi:hypothetical protein